MDYPFMKLWYDDYKRGTKKMSLEAKGLYMDMILELWVVGEMQNDVDEIAEELCLNKQLTRRVFKLISHKFQTKDGLISHKRVTEERLKLGLKSKKAQHSANIRWENHANAMRDGMRTQCYIESESDTESDIDNINTQNSVLKNQPEMF